MAFPENTYETLLRIKIGSIAFCISSRSNCSILFPFSKQAGVVCAGLQPLIYLNEHRYMCSGSREIPAVDVGDGAN